MQMRRITAQEVVQAYISTGLVPKQGVFSCMDNDGNDVACGLTAVALHQKRLYYGHFRSDGWHEKVLGITEMYFNGFWRGFDTSLTEDYGISQEWTVGFQDGLAAWKAVKAYMESKAAPTCQLPNTALCVAVVPSSEVVAS